MRQWIYRDICPLQETDLCGLVMDSHGKGRTVNLAGEIKGCIYRDIQDRQDKINGFDSGLES